MQGASDELRVLLFLSSLCDIMLLHCPLSREHIWQDGTISYIVVNTATGKTCWIGLGQIIPCNCIPKLSLILVSYCDWYNSGFLLAPGLHHFFFKLHYNNANSVLKLNNNYNLTNSDIFIHIYMRRHYNYDYILIIIFKYYPFIDLVQMYYDFTKYIVLWNYALKCNLESRNSTIL